LVDWLWWGETDVSELFIPGWLRCGWWYRLGLTHNLSTRALWQSPVLSGGPVSRHISGASRRPPILLSIWKEGVLCIFITIKNPSPWPGSNPRPLGLMVSTLTTIPPRQLYNKDNREANFGMEESPVFSFCWLYQSLWILLKGKEYGWDWDRWEYQIKIITVIKIMYENYICCVSHKGKLSDPFITWSGVKQGCLFSPLLFILVLDEVMEKLASRRCTGIRWDMNERWKT
jgi:hypothetical protein